MQLLLATGNLHKILEFKAMLKPMLARIDLYSLRDFPAYIAPKEGVTSFEENAELKATHAAKELNMLALADDSGLVVPALGGEPGVISARYAGEEATDKENREKLVQKLNDIEEEGREAYFECVLTLASPEKVIKTVKGVCEGTLLLESKGRSGFGYDPLFVKHDYNKTFAELEEDTKNRISHRRKAFDKLQLTLESELHCTI